MTGLITVEQVRERINFGVVPDVDTVIQSIIDKLVPDIEQALSTRIPYAAAVTDTWYVPQTFIFGQRETRRLWLIASRGFMLSLTSLVAASTRLGLDETTTDVLTYADVQGDGEGGIVVVSDVDLTDSYLRGTYSAGFLEGTDDLYADVPDWLQELAILRTILKLDTIHPTIRFADGSAISLDNLRMLIAEIQDQHLRYEPRGIRAFSARP